jgi:serine phosphatase RsbU (regulator of sigma subunit)
MMCAPLIDSNGHVLGALQVDTVDQRHRFQDEDLEVLVSVAAQAAIAIDNAQLHENVLRQRELERDLEVARQVQRGFLPRQAPELLGYDFFDFYQPARVVGGDYYDYLQLPDGRLAVLVADVVGHGIAAALLMAKLSANARFCLATEDQPAQVLTRLNTMLVEDGVEDRFVTLVMAVLRPDTHEVVVANAGHMVPLWRRGQQQLAEVGQERVGLPLGVSGAWEYEQCTLKLANGDVLGMYTDGLNEAMNDQSQLYGRDRLRQQFQAGPGRVAELGSHLIDDVCRFAGDHPQNDDMCLVCVGRE